MGDPQSEEPETHSMDVWVRSLAAGQPRGVGQICAWGAGGTVLCAWAGGMQSKAAEGVLHLERGLVLPSESCCSF